MKKEKKKKELMIPTTSTLTSFCYWAGLLIAHMALRYPMTLLTTWKAVGLICSALLQICAPFTSMVSVASI